jgi:hypothetical protein
VNGGGFRPAANHLETNIMATEKFRVVREHFGDKAYVTGDIRKADPNDVKHLVPHVLEPVAKAKAAPRKR